MIDVIRIIIYTSIFVGLFTLIFYLLGFLERNKKEEKIIRYPFVSVLIPAYNEEEVIAKTVKSVVELNYPKDKIEIIIIDDGSKDRTWAIASALTKKYENIKAFTKKNGGKGSALNLGIKKARGEIIISMDSDSFVTKDALIKMIPYFNEQKVMCVTPALKVYQPKNILERIQAIEYDLGIFLRRAFANANSVHVTPGPFSAYRKSFFDKYGGYDEKNITEDMEIAMRIQSLNFQIKNSMESLVYTSCPRNLYPLTRQRRRWYFGMIKNLWDYRRMFSKQYGELGIIVLPLAIFSILTIMVITFYYIFKGILDAINQINLYSSIGFDFINNLHFRWYLVSLNIARFFSETILIFGIFFFIVSVLMLLFINKKVKSVDRPISTFISYILFIFYYSILFTVWWLMSLFYSMTRKEIKW